MPLIGDVKKNNSMKSPIHFERKQLTDYIVCANFVEFSSTCLPMQFYSSYPINYHILYTDAFKTRKEVTQWTA